MSTGRGREGERVRGRKGEREGGERENERERERTGTIRDSNIDTYNQKVLICVVDIYSVHT